MLTYFGACATVNQFFTTFFNDKYFVLRKYCGNEFSGPLSPKSSLNKIYIISYNYAVDPKLAVLLKFDDFLELINLCKIKSLIILVFKFD